MLIFQDGYAVIQECFVAVSVQNVNSNKMVLEFGAFIQHLNKKQRFEWTEN